MTDQTGTPWNDDADAPTGPSTGPDPTAPFEPLSGSSPVPAPPPFPPLLVGTVDPRPCGRHSGAQLTSASAARTSSAGLAGGTGFERPPGRRPVRRLQRSAAAAAGTAAAAAAAAAAAVGLALVEPGDAGGGPGRAARRHRRRHRQPQAPARPPPRGAARHSWSARPPCSSAWPPPAVRRSCFSVDHSGTSPSAGGTTTSGPAGSGGQINVSSIAVCVDPAVVDLRTQTGAGTGMVLTADGIVLTNNHVVRRRPPPRPSSRSSTERRQVRRPVVGRSPTYDLAVLYVKNGPRSAGQPGVGAGAAVGDQVVAFGSPLGPSSTVTSGIVSALNRPVTTSDTGSDSSYINARPDRRRDQPRQLRRSACRPQRPGGRR